MKRKTIIGFILLSLSYLIILYSLHENKLLSFLITLSYILFYLLYALYHHISERTLNLKIFIEYVLIGFAIAFMLKVIILE